MRHLNPLVLAALLAPAAAQTPDDTPTPAEGVEAAPQGREALQKRLSAWRLRVATDATWADAEAELEALVAAAEAAALADARDEDLRALLADVHARTILWTSRRGDVQATAGRIVRLRLVANERSDFPRRTVSLAAAAALGRADVQEIEASIPEGARRASLPNASSHAEDVVIARAVQEAVKRGDTDFLGKLGTKAIPALVDLTYVMDGSPIPTGEADPLEWVFLIDRTAGYDVALELLRREEYLLERAVLDRFEKAEAFRRSAAWAPESESEWRLRKPEWIEIFDRLVPTSGPAGKEVQHLIVAFAEHGAIPPAMHARCKAVLTGVRKTSGSYRSNVFAESGYAFFAGLLDSPHAKVRYWAARQLSRSRSPEVLLGLATHPDREMRMLLARCLGSLDREEWTSEERVDQRDVDAHFELGRAYDEAARTLFLDPDKRIREHVAKSVSALSKALGRATLDARTARGLLSDTEVFSYEWFAVDRSITPVLPEADRLPTVLHAIEIAARAYRLDEKRGGDLVGYLDVWDYGLAPADAYWPIVADLERGTDSPPWLQERIAKVAGKCVERELLPVEGLLDWLEAHPSKAVLEKAFEQSLVQQQPSFGQYWPSKASSSERARILRLAADLPNHWTGGRALSRLSHKDVALDAVDVIALLEDVTAPRNTREWAIDPLLVTYPERIDQSTVKTIAQILGAAECTRRLDRLPYVPSVPDLRELVLAEMLVDKDVSPRRIAAQSIDPKNPQVFDLILERFPPESWAEFQSSELLVKVVRRIARSTSDTLDPRLAYANIRNSRLQATLAWVLGEIRSKAQFPLLADILRSSNIGTDSFQNALNSVTGFLDDEAAELLLETARATSHEQTRQSIMASLDQILAWQDAAARWERGRDAAARRIDAIDDLVGMTEDRDQPATVRAEALRGLGLLGAAEELPRLVRALTDPDESIRSAAREAIDRLHERRAETAEDE
ncbi:MAG: hypothetical protein AAGB93_19375 [Planctomycetota bacterium]